jgi:phosphoribosylglycinamide formyltransferase-1
VSGAPFAILASGTGSNALALHAAVRDGIIDAPLACIVSDRPDAPVVERARAAGALVVVVDFDAFPDRDTYEHALVLELLDRGVEHVVLAGYMRICGPTFLDAYDGRAINLHPSLLPEVPGRDAIGDALDAGATRTGVTIHFIDDGVDTGPVIHQEALDIAPGETRSSLAPRIHELEHRVLPKVVAALVRGEVTFPSHPSQLEASRT